MVYRSYEGKTEVVEGVFLHRYGYADEDRFTRLFREVWEQISTSDRKVLTDYWDLFDINPQTGVKNNWTPYIEILNNWSGWSPLIWGCTGLGGRELRLWSEGFSQMPDEAAKYLIATLLAPAYFIALGESKKALRKANAEKLAAGRWGFAPSVFREWTKANEMKMICRAMEMMAEEDEDD